MDDKVIYDEDIERLYAEAAQKLENANAMVMKRYGPVGKLFLGALHIDKDDIPKKPEELKALVDEVVAPWLEEHPEGWQAPQKPKKPTRRRGGRPRKKAVEKVEVSEEAVSVEEEPETFDAMGETAASALDFDNF